MYLYNAQDSLILSFDIEPLSNNPNESYTRNPDITGDFEQHGAVVDGVFFHRVQKQTELLSDPKLKPWSLQVQLLL
jgi:hypothetical protein